MGKLAPGMALFVLLFAAIGIAPGEFIVTFDELAFQPVDDLSVKGVTFDFKIEGADSIDAFYRSFGPGTLQHIDDPSLTGNSTGVLTLDFAAPTDVLEFAVALNTADPLTPGITVELFDASQQSLAVVPVDTVATVDQTGFSEGLFVYSGTPLLRAVLDFADAPGSFALDNLVHNVPEPSTFGLCLLGLALMVASRLCKPSATR